MTSFDYWISKKNINKRAVDACLRYRDLKDGELKQPWMDFNQKFIMLVLQ